MLYLEKFTLPSDYTEIQFIRFENRTCFNTMYPFKIFPDKGLERIDFSPVTIFYGCNGSGKTTLLNVIAQKLSAARQSEFNNSPLFGEYVNYCRSELSKRPQEIRYISSDDVFDYVLDLRNINEGIDTRREEASETYFELKSKIFDPEERRFKGLDDYDRWKEIHDAAAKKNSLSKYVKKNVGKNLDMCSNGETAMKFFVDRIAENAFDGAVSVESLHHFTKEEKIPLYTKLHRALKDGGYFILTDYFALSDEDERKLENELLCLKKEQGIDDNEFYHYDTPLTVEHETEALLEAGFSSVEMLNNWGATFTMKANK